MLKVKDPHPCQTLYIKPRLEYLKGYLLVEKVFNILSGKFIFEVTF